MASCSRAWQPGTLPRRRDSGRAGIRLAEARGGAPAARTRICPFRRPRSSAWMPCAVWDCGIPAVTAR